MTEQPTSPGAKASLPPLAAATAPIVPSTGAAPLGLAAAETQAGAQSEADTDDDEAPAFDAEPPIETPTPTQAEIDDIKRGVRTPDPPIVPAKKVRNMKPGRDGASTTRDL